MKGTFQAQGISVSSLHHCTVLIASDKHLEILFYSKQTTAYCRCIENIIVIIKYFSNLFQHLFFFLTPSPQKNKTKQTIFLIFPTLFRFSSIFSFWLMYELKLVPLLFNFYQINRVLLRKVLESVKDDDGDLLFLLAE